LSSGSDSRGKQHRMLLPQAPSMAVLSRRAKKENLHLQLLPQQPLLLYLKLREPKHLEVAGHTVLGRQFTKWRMLELPRRLERSPFDLL